MDFTNSTTDTISAARSSATANQTKLARRYDARLTELTDVECRTLQSALTRRMDGANLPPVPRQKILLVSHADQWLEVFAEPHVDVCHVARPHIRHVELATRCDELVELLMPRCYRPLYWPGKVRWAGLVRPVKLTDYLRREQEILFMDSLDAINGRKGARRHVRCM